MAYNRRGVPRRDLLKAALPAGALVSAPLVVPASALARGGAPAPGHRMQSLAAGLSARAGKDVYCENPCSMPTAESRALADTFLSPGRIYQAGTQRRNGPNFIKAYELARSGKLGKLRTVHAEVGPG